MRRYSSWHFVLYFREGKNAFRNTIFLTVFLSRLLLQWNYSRHSQKYSRADSSWASVPISNHFHVRGKPNISPVSTISAIRSPALSALPASINRGIRASSWCRRKYISVEHSVEVGSVGFSMKRVILPVSSSVGWPNCLTASRSPTS